VFILNTGFGLSATISAESVRTNNQWLRGGSGCSLHKPRLTHYRHRLSLTSEVFQERWLKARRPPDLKYGDSSLIRMSGSANSVWQDGVVRLRLKGVLAPGDH